jgi:putative tricarboxylic transport membrane protein
MADRAARPGARALSGLLLITAGAVIAEGVRLDGLASPSSAGAFPVLAGLVMAVCAIAIGLGRVRAGFGVATAQPALPGRVALVMALLVAFAAALPYLGFHLAAFVFLAVAIRLLRGHGTLHAVLVAAVSVAAIHVVFRLVFSVLLPEGLPWR